MPVMEIKAEAESAGISNATLSRAKESAGVRSRKGGNVWYWLLPDQDAA